MSSRLPVILAFAVAVAALLETTSTYGRGGGGGGGGGARAGGGRGGDGSFSGGSGGGGSGSYSRPSGATDFSRQSGVDGSRPSQVPSDGTFNPGGGRAPSAPTQRPAGDIRLPGGSAAQLPSLVEGHRAGNGAGPAQKPARPGNHPSQRPGLSDAGNFLGVATGAAAGVALANRPNQLPAERSGAGPRPASRPQERPNWSAWSQNRGSQWQQRVDTRHDAWNNWQQKNQDGLKNFHTYQEQRWNTLRNAQQDRQNWRDQNREDWQKHREDLWDYRAGRAAEVRSNARDFYDNYFDDRWWGACRWGYGYGYVGFGNYPANPWWWWRPGSWLAVAAFVNAITPDPIYIDYGMNVIYEGETVYVDNQPLPADRYADEVTELAVNAEPPPAPAPPAEGLQADWLPLGVYALAQEEKGDPIMFMQLSVNRAGVISGAYSSTLTNDQRPVTGQVDKSSQRVAWRIGVNTDTLFETSLANLTQDVSPVTIHFSGNRTQTWLLVRMPDPAPAGEPAAIPEIDHTPPPLKAAVRK